MQSSGASPQTPLRELLVLALPTVAQSVSFTLMQFIDTWMLSRLGTEAPTAVGNSGLFAFAIICFGWGMLLCVNTLVSQSFGAGRLHECGRYLWQGVWVGIAFAMLIVPVLPLAPAIFRGFGHSPRMAMLEAQYFQIVLAVAAFKMISTAAGQFLVGTNRANAVFVSSVAGVLVNVVAACGLVLGMFGMPKLGVVGAAWAQNIGVFVEMAVATGWALLSEPRKFNVFDWRLRWQECVVLVRIGAGAGLQVLADVLAWAIFMVWVMAQLGEVAMAANQFMFRYMAVSFMPALGISQAVTALVGRYIGMRRPDLALHRANLGFRVAAVYMVICGGLMVGFREPLIRVFSDDAEVVRMGAILLIFCGVYQLFDAMYVVYNGALRGAGDTLVPAIVTAGLCWGVVVLGGYAAARYLPQLGVAGPWTLCSIYGTALGTFMMLRFRRGRWRAIDIDRQGPLLPADSNVPSASTTLAAATID